LTFNVPHLRDLADGAVLAGYPDLSDAEANRAAVALGQALVPLGGAGLLDAIAGARTLLLLFDPLRLRRERLGQQIRSAGRRGVTSEAARRLFRIPTCYGGQNGVDLASLAAERGVPPEDLVRRHCLSEYTVLFIGFSPGFPYLGGLAPELHTPRLGTPRTRVPAGSVAIGGPYCGIYPSESPGGWRLLGRTPVRLFDAGAEPPSLLRPGDRVRFEPVGPDELSRALLRPADAAAPRSSGPPLLRILAPGLSTTVQGAPRFGLASNGVPPGGAFDLGALGRGNRLLGNPPFAPALEITLAGPRVEFLQRARAAVSGARIETRGRTGPVPDEKAVLCEAGEILELGRVTGGARAYLCVEGGIAAPPSEAGVAPRLTREQILEGLEQPPDVSPVVLPLPAGSSAAERMLRVLAGPQEEHFTRRGLETFLGVSWRASPSSDRRGIRLEGPPIELSLPPDIPPEGTAPGAVQVPGDGLPILLGPDRPVTGGYAKIATVIGADLSRLGQIAPGDQVRFRAVTLEAALQARRSSMAGT
jgi:KipI family sensor histidine kinase inhibitor